LKNYPEPTLRDWRRPNIGQRRPKFEQRLGAIAIIRSAADPVDDLDKPWRR
jgi:hypothetical protein